MPEAGEARKIGPAQRDHSGLLFANYSDIFAEIATEQREMVPCLQLSIGDLGGAGRARCELRPGGPSKRIGRYMCIAGEASGARAPRWGAILSAAAWPMPRRPLSGFGGCAKA